MISPPVVPLVPPLKNPLGEPMGVRRDDENPVLYSQTFPRENHDTIVDSTYAI